jgi:hypothetical protein
MMAFLRANATCIYNDPRRRVGEPLIDSPPKSYNDTSRATIPYEYCQNHHMHWGEFKETTSSYKGKDLVEQEGGCGRAEEYVSENN